MSAILAVAAGTVAAAATAAAPTVTITKKPPSYSASKSAQFEFQADQSATFTCVLDSKPPGPCNSPFLATSLADGSHEFTVTATNGGSVPESGSASYTWTVDTKTPSISVLSGPPSPTADPVARFEFAVDEPTASLDCAIDGGTLAACSSPFTTPALPDGPHTFTVKAADAAANATTLTYAWTVATPPIRTQSRPDTTPPETADALDYFVAYRYAEISWLSPTDSDFDHVTVFQIGTNGRRTVVYSGAQSQYVNRSFNNGVDHRYQVVSYDQTGNASPAVTVTISASSLFATPRRGARVRRAPALRWAPVSGAAFYNVQVFRNGRKIASTWPRRPRVQLAARWHYAKRKYSLTRGTYEWWVWPAFRRGKSIRYGSALGHSTFVKR